MFVKKAIVFLLIQLLMVVLHLVGNAMITNTTEGMYALREFNTVSIIAFIIWYLISIFSGIWAGDDIKD